MAQLTGGPPHRPRLSTPVLETVRHVIAWSKGGVPRIVATGMWGRDEAETLQKLKDWN